MHSTRPVRSARRAGLRWVTDQASGIQRHGKAPRFRCAGPAARPVRDAKTLDRIRKLAIPPAWTNVWICALPDGHLQATGRDAKGRKQYRYHVRWTDVRNETKFAHALTFATALPVLRRRIDADLRRPGLPRGKVIAVIVRLLQDTLIRVGNEEYARENGSYGLTTLRGHHVSVHGATLKFRFKGKSGKHHAIELADPRLARIVRQCKELPGAALFGYLDAAGKPQSVGSADVNAYLHRTTGLDLTAKDFRTWAGTVHAAHFLLQEPPDPDETVEQRIRACVRCVADTLGNTPAVCRKFYINPVVLNAYTEGWLAAGMKSNGSRPPAGLSAKEAAVLRLLAGKSVRGLVEAQRAAAAPAPASKAA